MAAVALEELGGPPSRVFVPNKKQRWFVERVNRRAGVRDLYYLKQHIDRKNFIDLAFYVGFQYVQFDLTLGRLRTIAAGEHVQYAMWNLIQPFVHRAVDNILKSPPKLFVPPASTDIEDRAKARVGQLLLDHYREKLLGPQTLESLVLWFVICGTAFLKLTFDPAAGESLRIYMDPASGQAMAAHLLTATDKAQLDAMGASREIRVGELRCDVVSPFEIYVSSYASSHDKANLPWLTQTFRRSREYLKGRYGDVVDAIPTSHAPLQEHGLWEQRILSLAAGHGIRRTGVRGTPHLGTPADDDTVLIREYHEPPSAKVPAGIHGVIGGLDVVLEDPGPCDFEEFIKFDYLLRPGSYWGLGLVENIVGMQRELNRVRSQAIEHKNVLLKPKLLVPRGSNIDRKQWDDRPGGILEYSPTGGAVPAPLEMPAVPPDFWRLEERLEHSMRETTSVHEVTTAQNPPNVRSGVAISLLQEQDASFFSPIVRRFEEGLAKVGTRILKLLQRHFPEERLVTIVGKNGMTETLWFRGADLGSSTDVRVEAGSALPYSRAGRQQYVLDLIQYGALNPAGNPRDRSLVLEMLDLGHTRKWEEQTQVDERNQEIEIDSMLSGEIVEVNEWDDHYIHLQVLNAFRKTDTYRASHPRLQAIVDWHADRHAEALGRLLQAQAEIAQPLALGPGSPTESGGETERGRTRKGRASARS